MPYLRLDAAEQHDFGSVLLSNSFVMLPENTDAFLPNSHVDCAV